MKEIIQSYKDVIVQIHTPTGSGSGFIVKNHNFIVTNRHVVDGSDNVVVRGEKFKKTIAKVLYSDALNDIAFLEIPSNFVSHNVVISKEKVQAGEKIIAIGHPLGLRFTATQGIVSKAERKFNNVDYIQVDAAINPGNSGGPLINDKGEIVGVNTFIYRDSESLGFALPSTELNKIINSFESVEKNDKKAAMCSSCTNISVESSIQDGYCPHCGSKFDMNEFHFREYEPEGVSKKIENVLSRLQINVAISRVGKESWEIEEGSSLIKISYNAQNGFIYADSLLGTLPKQNIGNFYEYLLKENFTLKNLSFSIFKQNIILGYIIHKNDLNEETAKQVFEKLFKKADYFDNFLAEKFGLKMSEY